MLKLNRLDWLKAGDEDRLRDLRLRALQDAPLAFGSDYEETAARPPSSWRRQIQDLPTVVAVVDGRDVGMVRGVPQPRWELISMWVEPEVRGTGVAEQLVEALGERAGELCLEVRITNSVAVRFYRRLGFETRSSTEDSLTMVRPVASG